MFWKGLGVQQDDREAFAWWTKAADQGHAGALNELAFCFRHGRGIAADPVKAFEYYQKAAIAGVPAAQYETGSCAWTLVYFFFVSSLILFPTPRLLAR
jgi:TPR repeat protein